MTSTDSPQPNNDSEASAPEPSAPQEHAPAAAPAAPPTAEAATPAGDAAEASPEHPSAEGEDSSQAEEGAAGAGEEAAAGPEGAPRKKRRRRRKKKGPHAEGQAGPPAEGAAAEGAATEGTPEVAQAEGEGGEKREERRKRDKKRRDEGPRERPAFGMGDVVFGKITEITDECLFIDLSGKGMAIFDRRELDLPEEPAQGPGSDVDDDDDFAPPPPRAEGEAPPAASTEEEPAAEAPRRAARIVQLPAPAEPVPAAVEPAAAAAEPLAAEPAAAAEPVAAEPVAAEVAAPPASSPHADTDTDDSDEPGETRNESVSLATAPAEAPVVVTLPPVVLEVGANFVGVVHNDGGRGGLVVLTRHPRRARLAKPGTAKALREKTTVLGLVTGVIKGGIEVDIDGLRAFAPGSHVDMRHGADLHYLIGQRLPFYVTQYAKRGKDVVLSRKSLIETEAKAQREDALRRLVVGNVVEGTVRSVVPFGAFIDVGGIEGLVPLTEMSHNRGDTPHDVFKQGETVQVLIQRIDVKGKVWLSHKATLADPWEAVAKKYAEGTRHKGKVARIQPFGVFVELEPGIDGLIHTADLSLKRIEHPSEVVNVGDEIDVLVASVEASAHRIGLHPLPADWSPDQPFTRVSIHKIVRVQVTAIDPAGLHVKILGATGRSARGYISGAGTGTPRGTELRKVFPVGSEHDAKVIEVDPRRGEIKLSIRAVKEDSERNAYKAYRQQVKAEAKFGTFGDLLKKSQEPKT